MLTDRQYPKEAEKLVPSGIHAYGAMEQVRSAHSPMVERFLTIDAVA